jgi:ribose 1,5-bisphosphokinase PhnN
MSKALIYVVGYPGSGKSTAMAAAMPGSPSAYITKPFAHTRYGAGLAHLGANREQYPGTDGLALNVQPTVIKWMETFKGLVAAEGDRLANAKFFNAALSAGCRFTLVYIDVPELVSRRRAWRRGSRFEESWLTGRMTKVRRLVAQFEPHVTAIDGRLPRAEVAMQLRGVLDGAG